MTLKVRRRVVISSESEHSPVKESQTFDSSEEETFELPPLWDRINQRCKVIRTTGELGLRPLTPSKGDRFKDEAEKENMPSCSICFTSPAIKASQPNCCSHTYCFDCLKQWSDMLNICPLCKRKFHFICDMTDFSRKFRVSDKKQPKYLEDNEYFNQVEEAIYCAICGSDSNEQVLLLCDGCNVGMHTYCLSPPLAAVPEDEWFCPECEDSLRSQLEQSLQRTRTANENRRNARRRSNRTTRALRRSRSRRSGRSELSSRGIYLSTNTAGSSYTTRSGRSHAKHSPVNCTILISDDSDEAPSGYASSNESLDDISVVADSKFCGTFDSDSFRSPLSCVSLNRLPQDVLYRYGIGRARAGTCSSFYYDNRYPSNSAVILETPENKT
eukprot:jgi/Galph1/3774/GphlegSOOS_G2422.1